MNPDLTPLVFCLGFLALGLFLGWKARGIRTGCPDIPNPPAAPTSPRVVVNVPADYKPLDPLLTPDGKPALVGPRALLFFAAYTKAVAAFSNDGLYSLSEDEEHAAYETAKMAVQTVYGNTFDA